MGWFSMPALKIAVITVYGKMAVSMGDTWKRLTWTGEGAQQKCKIGSNK